MKVFKEHWQQLLILLLVCLFLGLPGGEPFNHPDDVLAQMLAVLQNNGNPAADKHTDFQYPGGTVIYLGGLFYGLLYVLLRITGTIQGTDDFKQLYRDNTLPFFSTQLYFSFPGHLVTLIFSAIGIVATYFIAYKITTQKNVALTAGLFLGTSLLWVVNTHYVTVDIPMIALSAITTLLCLHFIEEKQLISIKNLVLIGIALGLTASTKWSGILIGTSIITSVIYSYLSIKKTFVRTAFLIVRDLALIFGIAGLVCVLTNPYWLPNIKIFLADVSRIMGDSKLGWYGHYTSNAIVFHLQNSFYLGYGLVPSILAGFGLIGIVISRSLTTTQKLILTVFPILFYISVGRSHMSFQRYILPIFPALAIYSAYGCLQLYQWIAPRLRVQLPVVLVVLLALSLPPNVLHSLQHNFVLGKGDTREDFISAINQLETNNQKLNVYTGAYLASYLKGAKLETDTFITAPASRSGKSVSKGYERMRLMGDRMDLIVFDSFSHDPLVYSDRDFWIDTRYENYERFSVIQLSPFTQPKEQVPFSPESAYSPVPPDVAYRTEAGPFIEMYFQKPELSQQVLEICRKQQFQCTALAGKDSYYLKQINQRVDRLPRRAI